MPKESISPFRLAISIVAIAIPLVLLGFGLYGTYSFTFSIPIFWQVGLLGKDMNSVGLKRNSFLPSAVTGILTGLLIAFSGGFILKALGMTGYSMDKVNEINSFLSSLPVKLTFQGETGYKLLSMGDWLKGALAYLGYCLFLVGLGEEIFWRGFIQKKISKKLPKNPSIWITAVVYGLVHSYIFLVVPIKDGFIFLGLISLVGAFWGYLYERFDNVWGPALSHGIVAFIVWKYFVFLVK